MGVGENIRILRKKNGLTQKKLAEKVGVNEVTIRSYEAGKYNPKIETLIKISEVLNCEISDIDENIVVTHHVLHLPELTPKDIEQYKKDAEARELIKRQASGEDITDKEHKKIIDYFERIKDSFSQLPERIENLKNQIDKISENILLSDYRVLNAEGQSEARKRVNELTEISRYTKPDEPPQE